MYPTQSGRYALALETLEKGVAMWGEVLDGDRGGGEACNPACGLEDSDEARVASKGLVYDNYYLVLYPS